MELIFQAFYNPRKQKCDCCDMVNRVDYRLLLQSEQKILGDLEVCESCAQAFKSLTAKEQIVQEFILNK